MCVHACLCVCVCVCVCACHRYSFRNQPEAVQFNLVMLANALLAADMVVKEQAEEALGLYSLVRTQHRFL